MMCCLFVMMCHAFVICVVYLFYVCISLEKTCDEFIRGDDVSFRVWVSGFRVMMCCLFAVCLVYLFYVCIALKKTLDVFISGDDVSSICRMSCLCVLQSSYV